MAAQIRSQQYQRYMDKRTHFYLLIVLSLLLIALTTYVVAGYYKLPFYIHYEHRNISNSSTITNFLSGNTTTERPSGFFQSLDGYDVWLYSAFYDHVRAQAGKPLVRLFGVGKKKLTQKVFCIFDINGTNLTSLGVITVTIGGKTDRYPMADVECPLQGNIHPTHVSVSYQANKTSANRLPILYPDPRIRNFTVCYSVLHSRFNMATQLIVSLEMNRILGAEQFMVYNYSISPEVDQILREYQDYGLVTVNQWQVPTKDRANYGQTTAINDCLYRNRNTSRFIAFVDTDELIIPRNHHTWMELIHNVSSHEPDVSKFMNAANFSHNKNIQNGCFSVKSSFFYLNSTPHWNSLPPQISFTENEKENIMKYNIVILSQIMRNNEIFPHTVRSKYIVRPDLVYVTGVHVVHDFTSSIGCLNINDNVALLHHYRMAQSTKGLAGDTSALKFKDKLYPRLMEQIKRFQKIFQ